MVHAIDTGNKSNVNFVESCLRIYFYEKSVLMDSIDLLAREDEFKKLNKQLEKKTESLMKRIEYDMQKQDFFTDFSHSLTLGPYHTNSIKKHRCDTPKSLSQQSTPAKTNFKNTPHKNDNTDRSDISEKEKLVENHVQSCSDCANRVVCDCCSNDRRRARISEDLEFLYAFVSVNVQEKLLPPSFSKDRVTVESVCKFLSSKVKLMQEQIDRLQAIINKKAKQCEVHLSKQAELETERLALMNRLNKLQASTATAGARQKAMNQKLEEKDRLYKEQRSENDKLTSEIKQLRSKNISLEARSVSLEDTIDSLKVQLEAAKRAEKDLRDSSRSLTSSHQSTILKLEGRIRALVTRAQKQDSLIKNLKEQRAVLTAGGALSVLEKQFEEFLKDF